MPEPATDQTFARFERFRRRFEAEAMPWLERRTVAIFKVAEGGAPTPEGSGVLIQVADRHFVITAAHVLDLWGKLSLIVPLAGGMTVNLTACRAEVTKDTEHADFAIIPLTEAMAAVLLQSKAFVRLSEMDAAAATPQGMHAVFGYPQELSRIAQRGRLSNALFYPTNLMPLPDIDPELAIAMEIHAEIEDSDGDRSRLPDLRGISGCGMWRLTIDVDDADAWSTDRIRLVGIEHTVRPNRWIRGTRIRHVVAGIASQFRELERSVSLVGITLAR